MRKQKKNRDFMNIIKLRAEIRSEKVKNFSCNPLEEVYNRSIESQRKSKSEKREWCRKKEMDGMKMSDMIADFIGEMLSDGGGVAELQRRQVADRFSCVPSQVNYVIETRFTPENGYLVESRRGGGGYIRIVRMMDDKQRTLVEAARGIGGRLTQNSAAKLARTFVSAGLLTAREGNLLLSACSDGALAEVPQEYRDIIRASVFRCGILGIAT